jgi:histidinol-phosphate phosphatase family protein
MKRPPRKSGAKSGGKDGTKVRALTIFLDRDGVLNRDPGKAYYVRRPAQFRWNPGVFAALKALTRAGARMVVVSNQAGVGKGLVSLDALDAITGKIYTDLSRRGIVLDGVFYCTCAPEAGCACRKPKPGLFRAADRVLRLGRGARFMVGDTERDVAAGRAAGCRTVLALTGKTRSASDVQKFKVRPDHIAPDLKKAVQWILAQKRS